MTAAEALRRARATIACLRHPTTELCHPGSCEANFNRWLEDGAPYVLHWTAASAILDGFTVRQVTAAEHTTDQPHE